MRAGLVFAPIPCRESNRNSQNMIVTAIALDREGRRHIVGIEGVDTESYISWYSFLVSLRNRCLSGVELVISDDHLGLMKVVKQVFSGCAWQRRITHFERNILEQSKTKRTEQAAIAAIKAVFKQTNPELTRADYERAVEIISDFNPKCAQLTEKAEPDIIAT